MIHYISKLLEYNWTIEVFILLNTKDINNIKGYIVKYPYYKQMINRLTNYRNSGFSYTIDNRSILVIGLQDSLVDFIETFTHEKNHIETNIGDYYKIQYDSEEFSILSGQLAKNLFKDLLTCLTNKNYFD